MKARFLEDVEVNDKKHGYKMVINKAMCLKLRSMTIIMSEEKRMDGER